MVVAGNLAQKTAYQFRNPGDNSRSNQNYSHQSINLLTRAIFTDEANNFSDYIIRDQSLSYSILIELWAREFELKRHILSQEEMDAIDNDVYSDFLLNSESYL